MTRGWRGACCALFVCSWAGNQFSPLLLMYQDVDGYAAVTVSAFLGVYVLGLVPALLVTGALSDRYGRRPLMSAATFFALATSGVLALGVFGPVPIYLGRLLAGITVGTAMAVGTSWLKELSQAPFDPKADAGSGARRASVAFSLGAGLGAGVAGVLAQWGPYPQVLPYVVHLIVTLPCVVIVRRIPETTTNIGPVGPLRDQLRVPAAAHPRFRRVVLTTAPWIFGTAALAYGYVPVLLREQVGGYGVAYATLLTVVALTVSAVVQPLAKRLDSVHSARGLIVALVVLAVAVATIGVVAMIGSVWLGVLASVIAGVGIGIALSSGLLEVQRIAGTQGLAGLTGVFYAFVYLGFLTPTVMAAITPPFTTPQLFVALVVLALACLAVVSINYRRHLPSADSGSACPSDNRSTKRSVRVS